MLNRGDKVIWQTGFDNRRVEATVQDLILLDDPGSGKKRGQQLTRAAWRLIRKGWVVVSLICPDETGTFWAYGSVIDPVPIMDLTSPDDQTLESMESLIRIEMREE